jgi:hypothetical protein
VSLGPAQEGEPVNLYATPYGGAKTLVASGNVDALGNFSRKVSPTVSTLYTAEYAGDGRFLPATIDQNYVVDVLMTGNMIKYQGKSGNYALYDANKTVLYEFTIKPDHTRSDIDMHVETHANGNWRELSLSTVKMPAGGKAIVGFPAAYLRPGKQYRIWGGFEYDGDHGPTHSPFGYFKLK